MFKRNVEPLLLESLADTPVVLLNGARQTGKTTLVQSLAQQKYPAIYTTLDNLTTLAAAKRDPAGFIAQFKEPVIIEEVQRAPEIFLPIKVAVDSNRRPGMFILTASANVLALPQLADTLAGRMEILTLWPLSQGEIEGLEEDFISLVFADEMKLPKCEALEREDLLARMLAGGYPPALNRTTGGARDRWYESYRTTLLERDVRDLSMIRDVTEFPRLLAALATRASTMLNLADLSRALAIQQDTLKRYYALLQALFLVIELPAWSANLGKRLMKTPKLSLNDTGLLGNLLAMDNKRLSSDTLALGQMLENFVVMELRKQATWSRTKVQIFHFRDPRNHEVDIVLENKAGEIVGIEVKATASPNYGDFKGLIKLGDLAGKRFKRGILLYTGTTATHFAQGNYALPIQSMWQVRRKS